MRSAARSIFGGAANAESHAGSLHPLVSPWIRAALVRDAGWRVCRGQRDARSNSEVFSPQREIIVDGNNPASETTCVIASAIKTNAALVLEVGCIVINFGTMGRVLEIDPLRGVLLAGHGLRDVEVGKWFADAAKCEVVEGRAE